MKVHAQIGIFFMFMSIFMKKISNFFCDVRKKAYIAPEITKERENNNRILITLRISK